MDLNLAISEAISPRDGARVKREKGDIATRNLAVLNSTQALPTMPSPSSTATVPDAAIENQITQIKKVLQKGFAAVSSVEHAEKVARNLDRILVRVAILVR